MAEPPSPDSSQFGPLLKEEISSNDSPSSISNEMSEESSPSFPKPKTNWMDRFLRGAFQEKPEVTQPPKSPNTVETAKTPNQSPDEKDKTEAGLSPATPINKQKRYFFPPEQVTGLKKAFQEHKDSPGNFNTYTKIGVNLGLTGFQVRDWFRRERSKLKRQAIKNTSASPSASNGNKTGNETSEAEEPATKKQKTAKHAFNLSELGL